MANGLSSPDSAMGIRPLEIKTLEPRNFTPLQEFRKPIMSEPPKYQEPTMTNNDKQLTDQLLAQIMNQEGPKNPQEAVKQVEKKIPQEAKKSQSFLAILWESIRDYFVSIFK
jgi:hypothetical protein